MKTQWSIVLDVPGYHRWFRDQYGRIAVADNSGRTPDETDDGVLYLVVGQYIACADDGLPCVWLENADGERCLLGGTGWSEVEMLRDKRLVSFA